MFVSVDCVLSERASIPFPLVPPLPSTCKNSVDETIPTAVTPPELTTIPERAVITPTESTLVTSSYVNSPPIVTSPVNVAATPVKLRTETSL